MRILAGPAILSVGRLWCQALVTAGLIATIKGLVLALLPTRSTTMDMHDLTRKLQVKNDTKIVMLVADGLGGLPQEPGGPTELEAARTPHLDALATQGVCGGSIPSPIGGPGEFPPSRVPHWRKSFGK